MKNDSQKLNLGFWAELPKPFFALAPMADVTDAAFRQMIAKHSRHGEAGGPARHCLSLNNDNDSLAMAGGGPDVFWTEFVSADGLCSAGRDALLRDLAFTKGEHPIVAQIFGSNPDHFVKTAELIRELGFDGIDINMGCPDKSIEKQGAGAALIKNPKLAQELILAAKEGARDIPVSVKTRAGYNKDILDEWLPKLLEVKPAAITVHARIRKDLSLVPARWDIVKRAVEIARGRGTLIIGNGDVLGLPDGEEKSRATGADGVMLGRAVFGTPWLFDRARVAPPTLQEKFEILIEHTHLFEKLLGDPRPVRDRDLPATDSSSTKTDRRWQAGDSQRGLVSNGVKSFALMKKHYKAYVHGFDGAKELRVKLMDAQNADEVEIIVRHFLKNSALEK